MDFPDTQETSRFQPGVQFSKGAKAVLTLRLADVPGARSHSEVVL